METINKHDPDFQVGAALTQNEQRLEGEIERLRETLEREGGRVSNEYLGPVIDAVGAALSKKRHEQEFSERNWLHQNQVSQQLRVEKEALIESLEQANMALVRAERYVDRLQRACALITGSAKPTIEQLGKILIGQDGEPKTGEHVV